MSLFTGSSRFVLDNNNITGVGRDFNITVTTHEPAADVFATLLGKRKERDSEREEDVYMFEKRRRCVDSAERRSDGLMLVERDQLNLLGELVSGADYQTHYASHGGRAVAVKVFEGPRAKQYCADNVAFSKKFLHSNVLKIVGVSKDHEIPFIVFHGINEKRIQSLIAQALRNDLSRSVRLAMKTVKGLASGLNYLKTQKIPLHNLDVFAGNNEEPVISIHFPSTGVEGQSTFGPENEGNGITALNGLCQKVSTLQAYLLCIAEDGDEIQLFSETNSVLYDDSPEREIGTYDSKGLPISLSQRDSKGGSNAIERESTPSKSGEQLQTSEPPRREVWWHDIGTSNRSLDVIARRFQDHIDCLLSLRRIVASKDSYSRRILHDCPGYLREEITLTSDVSRCAVVSHTLPSESELCSICCQLVHYQIEMENAYVPIPSSFDHADKGAPFPSSWSSPQTPSPSYSNTTSPASSMRGPSSTPDGVNQQQWQAGPWSYNPAYNPPVAQAQRTPWIPGLVWTQQQQGSGLSFNMYKRPPPPWEPSAEYLATELLDNPLGLTNMIPAEHLYASEPTPPLTPWIWEPKALQTEDSGPNADSARGQVRQSTESTPLTTQQKGREHPPETPWIWNPMTLQMEESSSNADSAKRQSTGSTLPTTQQNGGEQRVDGLLLNLSTFHEPSSPEPFTLRRKLQPTFSANITRTPDYYYSLFDNSCPR